jgi:hypothetical protein
MTLKFQDFATGGPLVTGDRVVGLRGGVSTIFNSQAAADVLLRANNLSDVSNADTSRTNLSAPKTSSGVGSPQGVVAGVLGDLYIDTSAPTDKFYVCVVAGTAITATWQLQTNLSGALLVANNLSDVANPVTSLSNLGGQPINIIGSGDPNGTQAGTQGVNIYFDTSTLLFWSCTQTGTSLTAVWVLQDQTNGNIPKVDLVSTSPTQLSTNTLYVGSVTSPSPAVGIMPIAPIAGDIVIFYAAAAAGVTVEIGTAGVVEISGNLIASDFFLPQRSSLTLRCFNAAGGGQWFAEGSDGPIIIDGSIVVDFQPKNIVGSGNPNGLHAGTEGVNFYFDTAGIQLWICTQTGNAATAVWQVQNQEVGGIDVVNLVSTSPAQMLANKLYVGLVASPSPAIGIMPIAPAAGDLLIVYASATAGVTIQKGTAALINITNNLVTTDLFIPFRNTVVLRCFNSSGGGQWFSESIDDTVIIDSTTTVGYQPLNIVGSGDPNGAQAGIAGVNFYFDTTTAQVWICTQTGNSATAVWAIQNQNEGGIETIDLVSTTPAQMLTNKFYVGVLSSPGPAVGIIPIAPVAGDVVILYAAAAQGVTVQRGTAALVEISGVLVTVSFFLPLHSNAVLRCFSAASGGQWLLESSDGPIIIDGTITVGAQPINIVSTGDPNGSNAGSEGVNFYFDTSTEQLWICTQTGNAATAVWKIQNEQAVETIDLVSTTPVQMVENKFYVGLVSSPSPAMGIMPIAPIAGDILIIYSPATQGVTVNIGTAALIEITGNLVTSSFFVPQRSNAVLRCFSAASGGQWFLESSDGPLVVDGTIRVGYVARSDAIIPNIFFFSGSKGSDTIIGNGSEAYPYASLGKAITEALLVASPSTPATVFAMGNETVTGNMSLYPDVNIDGYGPSISSLTCTGILSLDSTFDSVSMSRCFVSNLNISAAGGINFISTVSQQQQIIFTNAPILDTPTVNIEGSGGADNEVYLFSNGKVLTPHTPATYTIKNVTAIFENCSTSGISMDNDTSVNPSILGLTNNSTPNSLGAISISGSTPFSGTILFSDNSYLDSLAMIGDNVNISTDVTSYVSGISFSGGASFSNVITLALSDSINANINFTPANYSLPVATLYPQASTTNNLKGIDNRLGEIAIQHILYADLTSMTDVSLPSGNTQLFFDHVHIDQSTAYNSATSTYTAPADGIYEIMYTLQATGTGGAGTSNYWFDSAFYINSTFYDSGYVSNRNSLVAVGQVINTTNAPGSLIISLTAGDTVNVRGVNNGNIPLTIQNTNLSVKYIGP